MSAGLKRWKPYPEYKESGVEWLGEVPAGWEVWKLSHAFSIIGSGTTPKSDSSLYYDGDIPWVTTTELREGIISETKSTVSNFALTEYSALRVYPKGTLLVAMYGATIGRMGLLGIEATCNQACCALAEGISLFPKFLFFWFQGMRNVLLAFASGGGQPNLSQEFIKSILVAAPIEKEQTQIAAFLDQQCAQIDSLIEKKQRMLELLDEKRRAVITQAVTRGLDPTVPMKDSGVEWLGMVPVGWEVKRLKFCIKSGFQYGANIAAELDDPNLPRYIRITDMNDDGTLKDETFRSLLFEEAAPYLLQDKDILLARSGATVGKSFIYRESMGLAAYAGYLIRIATDKDSSPFFLYLFLNSQAYWQWIKSIFIQATIQNVSAEKYANFALTFPPLHEQQAIADYLDAQCALMDSQRKNLEKSIELLREYRSSLITHAVTGKIDVREFAPLQ